MKYLLLIALFTSLLIACKKDKSVEGPKVHLTINETFNDKAFELNEIYNLNDTLLIRIETLMFYISGVSVNQSSGIGLELYKTGADSDSMIFHGQPGNYQDISFHIGVSENLNHEDPSLQDADHPLSSFSGMHWSWAQGYKFFVLEGKFDSDNDQIPDQSFSYHIGNDDNFREFSINHDYTLENDVITDIQINLDIAKVLSGIDIPNNTFTHSTGQFELIESLLNNIQNGFSAE